MLLSSKNLSKAAAYLRLSREDGDKMESDSIGGQRDLITDFVNTHDGFELVDEYVDDGFSGTSFDRPAFQTMMQDVENKKIDCIIVKDLSRLGRNYIETGRLLEKIFPILGVRFVAINDNYDSFDQNNGADNIVIPFKNLINDAYSRDISIKIRSQLEVKRKNGDCVCAFVIYGYKKNPKDKSRIIVDEEAAEVVRKIFDLKLDGYSPHFIARKLNEMGIPTPLEYKMKSGQNFFSGFRAGKEPKWEAVQIYRILRNETYTGTMVQGKTQKINYKVRQYRKLDEADWIKVPDTHEAIIGRNTFDLVQEILEKDTRIGANQEKVYPLSGCVHCADCGEPMVQRISKKANKDYRYYVCQTNRRGLGCSSHMINVEKLADVTLKAIQKQVELIVEADRLISLLPDNSTIKPGLTTINEKIEETGNDIVKFSELNAKLFRDMQSGTIGKEEYEILSAKFADKIAASRESLAKLEQKKEQLKETSIKDSTWIEDFIKYRNITELDRRMAVTLIDHIDVFDKNTVEIHFRHEDEIREVLNLFDLDSDGEKEKAGADV